MIKLDFLDSLPHGDKENFYFSFLKELGFHTVSKNSSTSKSTLKFIGVIELGIISYQFLIHVLLESQIVTANDLMNLRNEKNPYTNKGLIISTATISKEAKKARVIRNDIPIDIIDKSELSKRLIKLNFDVSFYQSKN
jgi:hypothetical protein